MKMRTLFALLPALLALPMALSGQTATLVRDFAPTPSWSGTLPAFQLLAVSGKVLFTTGYPVGEPVVADGAGTSSELLADLCPGDCSSSTRLIGLLGDAALFSTVSGTLYRTDGTRAGTFALGSPVDPAQGNGPTIVLAGNLAYFFRLTAGGDELWVSDGTVSGTRQLPGPVSPGSFERLTAVDRRVFFLSQGELWTSDGTAAGTVALHSFAGQSPDALTAGADRLYLSATGTDSFDLWTSDGTASGTRQVASFPIPPLALGLTTAGDQVYLTIDDGVHGEELWTSDGTQQGTRRITDLADPSPFDPTPPLLAALDGTVVFRASGGTWASSGTPESTTLLTPHPPDPRWGFVRVGRRALFLAPGKSGFDLWRTDGTAAGTAQLAVGCTGGCQGVTDLVPFQGAALFLATDSRGTAVWTTDGTPAGTRPFSDPVPLSLSLSQVAAVGRRVFFRAGTDGDLTLWTSDGRPGGTHEVPGFPTAVGGAALADLVASGGRLLFTVCEGTSRQIWATDGTAAGTVSRTALPPDLVVCAGPSPQGLTPLGDRLFFWLADPKTVDSNGASAWLLWSQDTAGTADTVGTARQLMTVPYAAGSSAPPHLVPSGGEVFFTIPQGALWRSDGTPSGTRPAPEIAASASPRPIGTAGGLLFLTGTGADPTAERELWATDGSAAGTRRLLSSPSFLSPATVYPTGPALLFFLYRADGVSELWRTDATAAGTVRVTALPADIYPGEPTVLGSALYFFSDSSAGRGLYRADSTGVVLIRLFVQENPRAPVRPLAFPAVLGGRLFFAADDGSGRALWATDGTAAGTVPVYAPGSTLGSLNLGQLTSAGAKLFFTAWDQAHGIELWQSDGTPAGTRLAADIAPEGASSSPLQLTVAGDRLYFTANDGVTGRELWSLPLSDSAGCRPADTHLCLTGSRFQVEVAWKDFQGHAGVGHAVGLTTDTGYFWFFDPANVETVVKVLDARSLNQAFWVFYGALSNVEYEITITDTQTGLSRRYFNPSGQLASVGDTNGFGPLGAYDQHSTPAPTAAPAWTSARTDAAAAATVCVPGPQRLCLQGNRFAVTSVWKDFQGNTGTGTAVPLSGDTGYFWFFAPTNVEVVTKVLDGRALGGKFWFFYGALSNVEYTLTVTDTQTGAVKTYKNPSGQFGSVADTAAF